MEIKIRSVQFVKPSKSTPEHLRGFKLSLLDQLVPPSYVNLIFYYKANISDSRNQLITSLSEVLALYYPLAGRIAKDGLVVDCSDQGVKYLETQVSTRLDDFLAQGPNFDLVNKLIGAPDEATTSLVTVQVNVFGCGALVIGVSAFHKVIDGCSLVRFINEWASTNWKAKGGTNGAFRPSFDHTVSLFPPRENLPSSVIRPDPEAITVTKRFVFNGSSIRKLREKARLQDRTHSRVTLVASLIWKALISIDEAKTGRFRDCLLAPAMNFRGRTSFRIPESSFGNAWAPYPIRFSRNQMEPGFVELVTLVEDRTRKMVMWLAKASSEEVSAEAMACYAEVGEEVKQKKFSIFTSWCGFPMYEVDFGWGKPYWASSGGDSMEKVTLMDDKGGDGIEALVSLKEKDMYLFEEDEDISDFTMSI